MEALRGELEKLEEELIQWEKIIAGPAFYKGDHDVIQSTLVCLAVANQDIEEKIER